MRAIEQQKFIAIASKRPAWERQPREGGQSFDAFLIFRELGVKRTLLETAKICGKTPSLIRRWALQWDWYIRVDAWDQRLAEFRDKAAVEEAKAMGARQARLGMKLQEVGAKRLEQFSTTPLLQETLTANDTIRLIKEGADLERVARGEEKGEAGGNIIFNLNMVQPPKWAPGNVVSKTIDAVGKLVKDITTAAPDGPDNAN